MPSPADAGYLAFVPLTLAGLALLLRARFRSVPAELWVDGITVALGVAAASAAIVLETVLDHIGGAPLEVAVTLAYPLPTRPPPCASPTSGCTRPSTPGACRPATRARRCCCAR